MINHKTLAAALLAAFNLGADKADPAAVADAAASVLVAFADLVRSPAPILAELTATAIPIHPYRPDQSPMILAELRKQTKLLEVLAKQGDANRREFSRVTHSGNAISGLPG
jgi:hypothetical protein